MIRILDKNNKKVGGICSSCKVTFKYKTKDNEEFLCDKECQKTTSSLTEEMKAYIKHFKISHL